MNDIVKNEYLLYMSKLKENSVKESWVIKYLPNLYNFLLNCDGESLSEKIFLLENEKGVCYCGQNVKFLSISRGYRKFCSKKCSNNDAELIKAKSIKYKETCNNLYGFDNSSNSKIVINKIKESKSKLNYSIINYKSKNTFLDKYGVDNPSKSSIIKEKKKNTCVSNWGVDNPFKSNEIKSKIKKTLEDKYGVEHPSKSNIIKEKKRNTSISNWGVDNYTKTDEYKSKMFEMYRGAHIKTNLNSDLNYKQYLGLGKHELFCDSHKEHSYITNSHLFHARKSIGNKQCTICYPVGDSKSIKEKELLKFIQKNYTGNIISGYKDGLEIDIYLPDLKIGFEFNVLYWHSELFKNKNYHLDKTKHFKEKGIRIIHIWEDDWMFKQDIVTSQILNLLGKSKRIWARLCNIKYVSTNEYRDFLDKNHIQGIVNTSIKIGLYHNDILVSLMTFDHFEGRKSMDKDEWNLSRFCNKIGYSVVGGASKLFSFFIKSHKPKRVISFADKSWSTGELYNTLGFYIKSESYPNYHYIIDKRRSNKQKWKKSNLVKMGYDIKLSESKIMEDEFGAYKIFDCGQLKFEKKFN